jgi:Glycosyl hydrolase family 81 N-terminal domain/Glycosyl hydrolase family 81 C-terminal domain
VPVRKTDNEGMIELRGVQFVLQSQEGVNWMVFSSEPITFLFDTRIRTTVESSRVFKGALRAVIIPPSSKVGSNNNGMVKVSSSTGLRRLVYHASIYPIGAKVSYDFVDPAAKTTVASVGKSVLSGITGTSGGTGGALASTKTTDTQSTGSGQRVARVNFQFQTKGGLSNANTAAAATGKTTSLLMLSLPHHAFSFQKSHTLDAKHFDLTYHCIKGALTPVVGSVWSYEENLFTLGFDAAPSTSGGQVTTDAVLSDKRVRSLLADNLETDLNIAPPTKNENIYGYGKQIARLAQLAHIADRLVRANAAPATKPSNSSSHGGSRLLASSSSSLGDSSSSSNLDSRLMDIRNKAANKLLQYLEMLLTHQVQDSLLYDASLGGLISTNGLADFNADFGNGRYNGKP